VVAVEEAALAPYLETAAISDSARLEQRPLARRMDLNSLAAALPKIGSPHARLLGRASGPLHEDQVRIGSALTNASESGVFRRLIPRPGLLNARKFQH
jgi:hypothetical protein